MGDSAAKARLLASAKLSPAQAQQAAETKLGGKASDVSFDGSAGGPYYQVELPASDGTTQDVAALLAAPARLLDPYQGVLDATEEWKLRTPTA